MGIYSTLIMGREAVILNQKAIDVTGHNISNVNTPGYSRQRVIFQAKDPINVGIGMMGTGVSAAGIERIYDEALKDKINNASHELGKLESTRDALERVEIVFNESTGYGLNSSMDEFWNAWQDLANNPSGHTERTILLAKSENLATHFNRMYSDLNEIRTDLDATLSAAVDEINILATQIDELNDNIVYIEASEKNANDYRDERDQLMRELAEFVDFSSSESADGRMTITIPNGGTNDLVSQSGVDSLVATDTDSNGYLDIEWSSAPGVAINAGISGGKLNGILQVRDTEVPSYLLKLDTLAIEIRTRVNLEHVAGFDLDGDQNNDFFVATGTLALGTFAVDPGIIANVNNIAAADTNSQGDNDTAIDIANLRNGLYMSTNTATFDDYYNSLVSDVGIDVQVINQSFDYQDSMVSQLDDYRESISGVSLDEEMVNLIRYQHAYGAAAKLITTVDEMLDTLIAMV